MPTPLPLAHLKSVTGEGKAIRRPYVCAYEAGGSAGWLAAFKSFEPAEVTCPTVPQARRTVVLPCRRGDELLASGQCECGCAQATDQSFVPRMAPRRFGCSCISKAKYRPGRQARPAHAVSVELRALLLGEASTPASSSTRFRRSLVRTGCPRCAAVRCWRSTSTAAAPGGGVCPWPYAPV